MAVECIRASDTDRPAWGVYPPGRYRPGDYLGTLHARDTDGLWHVQATGERHASLADAVRTLRRPSTWPRERDRAATWARQLLADPALLLIDIQTTGLIQPFAAQISAIDGTGTLVLDELLNPRAAFEPHASSLHGLTARTTEHAATFSDLLPTLTGLFHGQHLLAYNVRYDHDVIKRELVRHHKQPAPVNVWLAACRWEDAILPISAWTGLWSAPHHAYRRTRLGGSYNAAAHCRLLLDRLHQLAWSPTP
ncbi:3'-5' exonuclease [Streptomyces sp. TLI_146]|uniref:3'-5' exonuclease n=1 Tax=Streptomyces sp. TLI_146 TaxID=1938858 RepID=UPI0015D5B04E|nr:3'-5' exonuclease [Streptomyces sp. TLI_146]